MITLTLVAKLSVTIKITKLLHNKLCFVRNEWIAKRRTGNRSVATCRRHVPTSGGGGMDETDSGGMDG